MNNLLAKPAQIFLGPLVFALAASSIVAADAAAETQNDEWKFRANIYGWLPSLEGKTKFESSGEPGDAPEDEVDVSKILDSIEGAFMGGIAAEKGQWGIFSDYIYIDLSNTSTDTLTFSGPNNSAGVSYKNTLGITGWVWDTAGTYSVVDNSLYSFKLLGGVRFLDLEEEFKWKLASDINEIPVNSRSGKVSVKDSFVDAIIGVRGRVKFGESNWAAPYYLDVGTGQTDFTWQASAGINYAFESIDLSLSYRYMEWDFEPGKALQSLSFSGVQFGVGYRW